MENAIAIEMRIDVHLTELSKNLFTEFIWTLLLKYTYIIEFTNYFCVV